MKHQEGRLLRIMPQAQGCLIKMNIPVADEEKKVFNVRKRNIKQNSFCIMNM